jgi:RNA polymerase sigma factor (sigma-70 family)
MSFLRNWGSVLKTNRGDDPNTLGNSDKMPPDTSPMDQPRRPDDPNSTMQLLARFRAGDQEALERLFERYLPVLVRWTSGRLPRWARDISDTHDLVQEATLQTFKNMEGFEHRGEGALQAYLRQAVMNRIRDQFRKLARSPSSTGLPPELPDEGTTPFEAVVGAELLDAYDAALDRLDASDREAIIARIELGLTYAELAEVTGKPTPDAARMAVARALVRLAEEMGRNGT